MDKILTVIVPTYNMEKYLHRCLDSLIVKDQSLFNQLEVLVINDGSKDSSSAIAHEYENRFPNVFRGIDKENGNYGSCVNRGLKEATGKYVKILDADDSFCTKTFENYLWYLSSIDVDMVITNYVKINEDGKVIREIKFSLPQDLKFDFSIVPDNVDIEMHSITYKLDLIRSINYHQTEGISYTDVEWSFIPLREVKSICYYPCTVYQYLFGRVGQTVDKKIQRKNINMMMHVLENVIKDYSAHNHSLEENYLLGKIRIVADTVYKICLSSKSENDKLKLFDDKIKKLSPKVWNDIERNVIKPYFPYHYVKEWRNKRSFTFFFVMSLYRFLVNNISS